MADEAKIVVELQDRSQTSVPNAASAAAGTAPIPGANLAGEFHQKVSTAGAGTAQGAGSQPLTGDPLLRTVRGIVEASPQTTAEELQKGLGVTAARAADLLKAAKGETGAAVKAGEQPLLAELAGDEPILLTPLEDEEPIILGGTPSPTGKRPRRPRRAGTQQPIPSVQAPEQPGAGEEIVDLVKVPGQPPRAGEKPVSIPSRDHEEADRHVGGDRVPRRRRPSQQDQDDEQQGLTQRAAWMQNQMAMQAVGSIVHLGSGLAGMTGLPGAGVVGAAGNLIGTTIQAQNMMNIAGAAGVGGMASIAGGLAIAGAAIGIPLAGVAAIRAAAENTRERLQNISPEVAMAEAHAELRQLRADLRTRDALGEETARYVTSKSQLSEQFQGLQDQVLGPLMNELSLSMKLMAASAAGWNLAIEKMKANGWEFGGILPPDMVNKLNEWLDKQLGTGVNITPYQWMENEPFATPPWPFRGAALRPGRRRTVDGGSVEFEALPGLDFGAGGRRF